MESPAPGNRRLSLEALAHDRRPSGNIVSRESSWYGQTDAAIRICGFGLLDVTVELGGYMADACESVAVPPVAPASRRLIDCARDAFDAGLAQVRPGVRAYDIGDAVHATVRRSGFTVVRALMGHGIGRTIHEAPSIPNDREPRCADVLTEGMVFTIEPLIAAGTDRMVTLRDGWTLRTRDRARSAHHEHTVMVTATGARLLTA